jgi:hypothetical protein
VTARRVVRWIRLLKLLRFFKLLRTIGEFGSMHF